MDIYFRRHSTLFGDVDIQIDLHLYPNISELERLCVEKPREYFKVKTLEKKKVTEFINEVQKLSK